MRVVALLVVTASLSFVSSACGPTGGREELTVVVEAERTRALADQARLAEMQAALADARKDLEATRGDLTVLREKLLAAGALSADEARRLEERERMLADRETALGARAAGPSPSTSPGGGLTRDDVEALLRAQEDRLRSLLQTAQTAPTAQIASSQPSPGADAADVSAELATIRELRARRGLRPDDVEGGPTLERRIDDALRARKAADALALARDLAKKTEATVITASFIRQKYERAQRRLNTLQGEALARGKTALGDANTKNARGDHEGANAALNLVLDL